MYTRLPLLAIGLSALGACATINAEAPSGPPVASAADRHEIAVAQTAQRLEIQVAAGDTALSPKSQQDLQAFASGYLRYGHGALILSAPEGGSNASAASRLAEETRRSLVDAGVSYAAIAPSTYDGSAGGAPIVVSFARFEAEAPACAPIWEQDLAHQMNNQAWDSFGCATQANLAALIEDPRDLLGPRNEDPRDAGRRDNTFAAYREGRHTHAERTDDERVAISNAVQ